MQGYRVDNFEEYSMNSSVSKAYAKMRRFCDGDPAMRSRIEEMMDVVENADDRRG